MTAPMHRVDLLWRAWLLAVVIPVLVGGFAASALANRWIFAVWALASAILAALALRRGFEVWWGRPGARGWIAARVLTVLAPAAFVLAWLVQRHQEILDLGLRAVWPGLHAPAATAPTTYLVAAVLLTAAGVVAGSAGWIARSRAGRAHSPGSNAPS